jgi:hypothetical protein
MHDRLLKERLGLFTFGSIETHSTELAKVNSDGVIAVETPASLANNRPTEAVFNAVRGKNHSIYLVLAALVVDDVARPEFGQSKEPISVYRMNAISHGYQRSYWQSWGVISR